MRDEEILIVNFLQCSAETWFTRKEIARRAVRRKVYDEDPHWLDTPLSELVARKVVDQDVQGRYRMHKDELLE